MMLARMPCRFCRLTLRKPVCCGFCAHWGHAGLPCASMVIGVFSEKQRPTASAHTNTAIPTRFIGFILLYGFIFELETTPNQEPGTRPLAPTCRQIPWLLHFDRSNVNREPRNL